MQTQIEFLQKYRDDLLEAAWRESMRGPRRERPWRRPWQGWSRKRIVTLATAATLAVSGLIGFFALRHTGPPSGNPRYASLPSAAPRAVPGSPHYKAVDQGVT